MNKILMGMLCVIWLLVPLSGCTDKEVGGFRVGMTCDEVKAITNGKYELNPYPLKHKEGEDLDAVEDYVMRMPDRGLTLYFSHNKKLMVLLGMLGLYLG
jgi:hypothetical protein